jgi:transketolase
MSEEKKAPPANLRSAYGEALVALGRRDGRVVALEADLGKSTQSAMFKAVFPERHFEMGIAEQNMASTAAGMALAGKTPFIHSFAVFASGRDYDQLRCSVCIPGLPVRICGSSAGLSDFGDGKTHQSVEDVALMRALPNMTVLCPMDSIELAAMMENINDVRGPVYLRVNRNDLPLLHPDGPYRIGQTSLLREGRDVCVFASGIMASKALEAAAELAESGISARVVNVGCLKPIDGGAVKAFTAGARAIVCAEEHSVIGGLGSAVSEALRGWAHAPVEYVGIEDSFGTSAENYGILLEHFGLNARAISAAARKMLALGREGSV